nr:YciI family protein [Abyssibacter sp.]
MMAFAIVAHDAQGSLDARAAARPAHLARLNALQDAGRLLLAGPLPITEHPDASASGYHGSLIVAEFESIDDARAWADADPYQDAGVYTRVDIFPFKPVYPQ